MLLQWISAGWGDEMAVDQSPPLGNQKNLKSRGHYSYKCNCQYKSLIYNFSVQCRTSLEVDFAALFVSLGHLKNRP
jgi:hypothetical protein